MWGVCVAETCGSAGVQSRAVWCVHSEGWTTHPSNCVPSERPSSRRACVRVCEWHRTLFEWHLSSWGTCSPISTSSSSSSSSSSSVLSSVAAGECVTAQRGVQRRRVMCSRRTDGEAASDERVCEAFSPRPSDEQACLLPCPINCVLSAFSHWSPCRSQSCGSAPLQHRTRQVLAAPLYGGAECPSLTQTRRCHHGDSPPPCPASQPEHSYSLWAGPWSECRVRAVGTTNGRTRVDFSMEPLGRPKVKRSDEAVFVRRHTDSIFRLSHHHQHPHSHHPHHVLPAESYDTHVGYQTRQVRCIRSDGKNVMLSLCDHDNAPVNFRTCVMPRDCEVSDWSEWSPCSKTCRTVDQSPGYRTRKRHVKGLQIGEGKECPALEEKEACNLIGDLLPVCPSYQWLVTDWGRCESLPLLGQQDHRHGNASFLCGGGLQTREVYCARVDHSTSPSHKLRPVRRDLCAGPLPSLVQNCSTPCPELCLLSHWTDWGPCVHDECNEPQGRRGFHVRRRSVLRGTAGAVESCPHLTEAMPCDEPTSCFSWRVTSQGPCSPQDGLCGPGTQKQKVECVTASGEAAPNDHCLGDQPPTDSPCELACGSDCVLSDWSPWSQCSLSCSGKHSEGKQHRTRSVLALPGEGGAACPNASALQQWRLCGSGPCVQLHWTAGPWGPCTPDPLGWPLNTSEPELTNATCGLGTQMREVTCVKANNGVVTPKRCPISSRPLSERMCELPCPVSCVVTPFSEWSPCPDTCSSENATVVTQSRHRIIIQRPANGGQDCPDTLYEERECEPAPACPLYRWQTYHWHKCILVPDSVRQAVGASTESCGQGLETRGRSKKRVHCQQSSLYPLVEREPCPCSEFLAQPQGSWSPCLLPGTSELASWHLGLPGAQQGLDGVLRWRPPQLEVKECGQGRRYRALACLNHHGQLVGPTLCASSGLEVEECHVACPLDCRLSEWSPWSSCNASCGWGVKVRAQWLKEKAFNGGRPCPKLDLRNQVSEVLPCYSECDQYSWEVEPWSDCHMNLLDTNSTSLDRTSPTSPASSNDTTDTPSTSLAPTASSPYDVTATPTWPQGALSCGDGVQSRKASENAVCGRGIRTRLHRCVRSDGRLVEMDECTERGTSEELVTSCEVSCPVNCLLSAWSPWSECSHTCGNQSQMLRSRMVLQEAGDGGQPCPAQLSQTKPCPIRPCYSWLLGDWSSCQIEGAECGEGLKVRNLTCVVHWGALSGASLSDVVEEERCDRGQRQARDTPVQLACSVPCPGDCHLTEWSSWSSCQLMCMDGRGFETQGRQARSRAVIVQVPENQEACPSQVYEMRPCKGGCLPHMQPSAVRHCHPPCTKPFSFCTQGFTEVMTSHGFLDYCTRTPGPDHKKADVKTGYGQPRPGRPQHQNPLREWALQAVGPGLWNQFAKAAHLAGHRKHRILRQRKRLCNKTDGEE
ncbi:hypothetical protein ACEWY4_016426 [Coilia grayii]|uniref:Thrombospondin type-1 domain-containing protein 7A n=1 Tax=Coilia grayii TaxID=363190 RepID=A0ABD1JKB0_9TELE